MNRCSIIRCKTAYNNSKIKPVFARTENEDFKHKLLNNKFSDILFACYKHFLDTFLNTNEKRVALMRKTYPLPTLQKDGNFEPHGISIVH